MSYHGLSDSFDVSALDVKGKLSAANEQAVNSALSKMEIAAVYAGPISKAEQDAVIAILDAGSFGSMPTPAQFANIIQSAGSTVVTGIVSASCGPAAPLCGIAAGYVTSKIGEAIFGSGGGCSKINGMCAGDWWNEYRSRVMARCPPGSESCRKKLNDLWYNEIPMVIKKDAEKQKEWDSKCKNRFKTLFHPYTPFDYPPECFEQCPEPRMSLFGNPSDCVKFKRIDKSYPYRHSTDSWVQNPSGSDYRYYPFGPSYSVRRETAILVESRYEAEYRFLKSVDDQTKALQQKMVPLCKDSACKTQVSGIIGEGVYEAAMALRASSGGPSTAGRVMDQAMLQVQGVIDQSKNISDMKLSHEKALESESKSVDSIRKIILASLSVLAVATCAVAWSKHRGLQSIRPNLNGHVSVFGR